ncbi:MAG: M3 family oligoendopeptidase [Candidatus Hodarchaeota archaeon]
MTQINRNWDLSFMYKGYNDPKIDDDIIKAEKLISKVNNFRGQIKSGEITTHQLLDLFQKCETIKSLIGIPRSYGFLLFAQDTTNEHFKSLYNQMEQKFVEIENQLIWIELEINEMADEVLKKCLNDPVLSNYHHFIKKNRLKKPYLLTEDVEKVLKQKNLVGRDAWENFYNECTASFQFELEINGDKKILSPGELRPLFVDPRPEVREQAFKTYYQKYADNQIIMNHCFNNIWKNHGQNAKLRKYPSVMTIAHIRNETEEEIVQTMIDVIRENYNLVQDYYKAKAKLLGQGNKIKGSDLYAPLGKDIKFTWDEAKKLVLEAYSEFDPEIGKMAKEFFTRRLIDSEVRKGKITGAFCMPTHPKLDPVIHMSYTETPDSVSTLAHEIGHGLHEMFASRKQTYFNYRSPTVMAETASVFGEKILIDKLLKIMTDDDAKLKLIASQLEDAIVTISRQTMYVLWEEECHKKGSEHNLSAKEMSDIWDKYVKEAYGDSVDFLSEQSWNWSTIPHFLDIRTFYCYAYSFGMLFVLGLYQKYLEEGPDNFIPKFKSILEAGGSQFPVNLAKSVNLDITIPNFWQAGFDYLKMLLNEFQEIVEKLSK